MITWPAVVLRSVKKSFPLGDGTTLEVLDVEDLSLPVGSCTVLRGRSGSGKTTLLNLIAGVSVPTAGTIHVDGTEIVALPELVATDSGPSASGTCSRRSTCSRP